MNQRIKAVYVGVSGNVVKVLNTNLLQFCNQLVNIEPEARNYEYYKREFKKESVLKFVNSEGVEYLLQKIE